MVDFLANRVLWVAILADAIAQLLKVLLVLIIERQWVPERLFGSGGMPSSHSALVSALATGVAIQEGLGSSLFAVTTVVGLVIIYDAMGVRRAAGQQAHILNELIVELGHVLDEGFKPERLKTLLGHTLPQVVAGVILGVSIALLLVP